MTTNNNIKKRVSKTSQPLESQEIELLKKLASEAKSLTAFAIEMKLERTVIWYTMIRGTASPETVVMIRKFLRKHRPQLQTA